MPLRILMVEDSPDDAELILRELRSAGLDVTSRCVDTAEAMRQTLAEDAWDVVLSDHAMPAFSSDAALDLLKQSGLDLPFIIVSGTIGEEHAVAAMRAGAHDYIMKDNLTRLPPAVQRELREAHERQARRKAEHDRRQLEQQLQQSQKMQSLGVLAGGIAHDFNNLLAVIRSNARLLGDVMRQDPAHHRCIQDIELAASHAVELVRSLQAFSRPRPPQNLPVDANTILQGVHRLLCRLVPASIDFRVLSGDAPPLVFKADPGQIQQILVNLCVNARDAMPAGGTLELQAAEVGPESLPAASRAATGDRYIRITIRDTGIGMNSETLRRAFDPFFTTKPKDRGTGLGLALVYRIVEAHQGAIDVSSKPGQGTTFNLFFPAMPSAPCGGSLELGGGQEDLAPEVGVARRTLDPKSHLPFPPPCGPGQQHVAGVSEAGSERVLVAGEDELICSLVQTSLEACGYRVQVARSLEQPADLAQAADTHLQLAVIDVSTPAGPGGWTAHLRRNHPRLPLVLMAPDNWQSSLAGDPGVHVLIKPFGMPALIRLVRHALDASSPRRSP